MTRQKIPSAKFARKGKSAQQGVVLLEALIAMLIFSMGVLALVGLQAAMIKNTSDSKYRAEASFIAQQRIGMIWADPANALTYLETRYRYFVAVAQRHTNCHPAGRRPVCGYRHLAAARATPA